MHHHVFGINFLLHSVSFILMTLLHTLSIPHLPVHLFHHHHCHLSLLLFFHSNLMKIHPFHKSSQPIREYLRGLWTTQQFLTCVSHTAHVINIGWTSVRLSVRLFVCLSVRHTLVLCRNDSIYRQTVFTAW